MQKKITSILISVYNKTGIAELLPLLQKHNIKIYSTGGTYEYIESLGYNAVAIESITGFPSIFGGRVKTLHPAVFGGILARSSKAEDKDELEKYAIPTFDCVVVDLYPFEKTVAENADEQSIIEKIDIGGISLIRAAAKNFNDVVIIPAVAYYDVLKNILNEQDAVSDINQRKDLAKKAFGITNHYDGAIQYWFSKDDSLRYGENPHQSGAFLGNINELMEQLHGKEISYNNLLDIDSALNVIVEFNEPTVAILKHNNTCGIASDSNIEMAYAKALAGDPIAAFGGVIVSNGAIDMATATELNKLFFEVIIAPSYTDEALQILKEKKNRIIIKQLQPFTPQALQRRTLLNGTLVQDYNNAFTQAEDFKTVTTKSPSENEISDMIFANKIVKHLKSNAIAIVKNKQLIAMGCGQTSRIDALNHAIHKAAQFKFDLHNAVMASDAFFPFADCVTVAQEAGITAIVQPGGSIKDIDSINYCNEKNIAMVTTGTRHFRH